MQVWMSYRLIGAFMANYVLEFLEFELNTFAMK